MGDSPWVALALVLAMLSGCTTPEQGGDDSGAVDDGMRILEVVVYDDTEGNPVGDDMEVWVRGHGSWHPDVTYGSDSKELAAFPVGETRTNDFYVYPDGRDGVECAIAFTMTSDMISGSTMSMTHVEISDETVSVRGQAVDDGDVCAR